MSWKKSEVLMDTIKHYSSFPATGVSLRQMVQFGEKPSTGMPLSEQLPCPFSCRNANLMRSTTSGTLFRASQFLSEELPIRLAHRVQELDNLPDSLNEMASIRKVKDWYAQSFEEITQLPRPSLSSDVKDRLLRSPKNGSHTSPILSQATQNPSVTPGKYRSSPWDESTNGTSGSSRKAAATRRYYATVDDGLDWPPELHDYNQRFAKTLEVIKRRHDGVVTTIGNPLPPPPPHIPTLPRTNHLPPSPSQPKASSNTSASDNACRSTPPSKPS